MESVSLARWIKNYKAGKYNKRDVHTMIEAGWYDWFCKDSSLYNRFKRLAPKVVKIANTKKLRRIGLNNVYVWFKNNAPLLGPLYDDFRIASRVTGDVLFAVIPNDPHNNNKSVIYSKSHHGEFVFNNWQDVIKWFNGQEVEAKYKHYP